jgi:hypothetical protein
MTVHVTGTVGRWTADAARPRSSEIFTEAVLGRSTPFVGFDRGWWIEHRRSEGARHASGTRSLSMTSGLHTAPISATEHRASTGQSTRDIQTILAAANLQVTALLRVRRQGLEPRTRGLRVRYVMYRPVPPDVISCHFHWSTPSHCVASCRLVPVVRAATEHRSSTAAGRRCSIDERAGEQLNRRSSGLLVRWPTSHVATVPLKVCQATDGTPDLLGRRPARRAAEGDGQRQRPTLPMSGCPGQGGLVRPAPMARRVQPGSRKLSRIGLTTPTSHPRSAWFTASRPMRRVWGSSLSLTVPRYSRTSSSPPIP